MQKLSGDAAVVLHPAATFMRTAGGYSGEPTEQNAAQSHLHFRKLSSAIFANQGNQESRTQTARRSLHAGKVPNGVRLEKPVAPLSTPRLPEIRFLELAKGFEPLTL